MSVSVLQLVKRTDGGADIDSVDLMSLPIELQYEGWRQATPTQQGQDTVDDVITLLMNGGNDNALATALQSIDTKVKQTQWAQDPLNPIGVWLRSRLSTETNTRQAFIKELRRGELSTTDPLAYNSVLQQYSLGVTRMPVWENTSASTLGGSKITGNGGKVSYTIAGDAHARVAIAQATSDVNITDLWYGVKSDRYGVTPANFVPFWPLYQSKVTAADIATASDSTAQAGTRIQCDFSALATMRNISSPIISDITANYSDQRGKYNVLLRAMTDPLGDIKVNVRIGVGYRVSTSYRAFSYLPRTQIGGFAAPSGWVNYPLGVVSLPPVGGFSTQGLSKVCLTVQAEKTDGTSGSLYLDGLFLVPAEHNIHIHHNAAFSGSGTKSYIMTRPDQKKYSILYFDTSDYIFDSSPPDDETWSIPSGSGVIACVAGYSGGIVAAASSVLITPTFTVYPSYSSLRGSV